MSPTNSNNNNCRLAALIALASCLLLVKDAPIYADAAPSNLLRDMAVLPRTLPELVDSDAFERIWRKAAEDQIAEKFGNVGDAGGDRPATTRNMVGDYVASDEFHQAVCKGGNQGMSAMGGMMGSAPAPWSYMGTFIGSDKFQHGTCDMMSQGMSQFGTAMNGWFRSSLRAAAAETADYEDAAAAWQDPMRAVDAFFRSEYYAGARQRLRDMFSDVRF